VLSAVIREEVEARTEEDATLEGGKKDEWSPPMRENGRLTKVACAGYTEKRKKKTNPR